MSIAMELELQADERRGKVEPVKTKKAPAKKAAAKKAPEQPAPVAPGILDGIGVLLVPLPSERPSGLRKLYLDELNALREEDTGRLFISMGDFFEGRVGVACASPVTLVLEHGTGSQRAKALAGVLARHAFGAALNAISDAANATDENLPLSDLSALGGFIERAFRRLVVLDTLTKTRWNLAHTGELLNLGSTPNVLRAIRELGLSAEYEAAKAKGLILRGRPAPRTNAKR